MSLKKGSNWLIFLGLLIAITGMVRTAPDLVRAMTSMDVDPVEAALVKGMETQGGQPEASTIKPIGKAVEVQTSEQISYGLLPHNTVRRNPELQTDILSTGTALQQQPGQAVEQNDILPSDPGEASPVGEAPLRLVIPSIELDAPVVVADAVSITVARSSYMQWMVPNGYAVGWHEGSQLLGLPGNTILNGHHNTEGKVFANLEQAKVGEQVVVYSAGNRYEYTITNRMILPEKWELLDVRMENARWIQPSNDERLTLITCWPATSNTHRLILVAKRASAEENQP